MKILCCICIAMEKLGEFYRKDKVVGIVKVENMLSGKILLLKSFDVVNEYKNIRFSLDMGTFDNVDLQKDYEETGLELFDISLDKECSKENIDETLNDRETYYKSQGRLFY